MLIKDNMARGVNSMSERIKAKIAFVHRAISYKDARGRTVLQLIFIIGSKAWETKTVK